MLIALVTLWIGFTAGLVCAALVRAGGPDIVPGAPSSSPRRRLTRVRH